ncbi:MAG: hypothetical protein WKF30_09445 [Pyrinomonadaceae bacterium]
MKNLFTKTLVLVLGLFLILPTVGVAAQRQDGDWGRRDDWRREQRRERRERREERREDRRDDRRDRRDDRRGGGWGSNGGWGNNGGWGDGNSNYGGSFQLRQTALNAGYNNGIQEGRKDGSRGDRYDFRDEGDYQKATEDYSSRLGDRELYRRYFREGFENGYRDGYRNY